jgi:hypothetical protein
MVNLLLLDLRDDPEEDEGGGGTAFEVSSSTHSTEVL